MPRAEPAINIKLGADLHKALRKRAAAEHLSMAQLIRRVLWAYVE